MTEFQQQHPKLAGTFIICLIVGFLLFAIAVSIYPAFILPVMNFLIFPALACINLYRGIKKMNGKAKLGGKQVWYRQYNITLTFGLFAFFIMSMFYHFLPDYKFFLAKNDAFYFFVAIGLALFAYSFFLYRTDGRNELKRDA